MSKSWPRVKLGDVLDARRERVQPDPLATYKEVTVRLWGKGVVERGLVSGVDIGSTVRFRVHQQDFVLSKIDARNGALGIVPESLDGALVSSDFPAYQVKQGAMLPKYMGWLCKTTDFVETCRRASEGTTNRVRVKINRFLSSEIPLPSLDEQKRIVAHLDALSDKVTQARGIRQQATEQADRLIAAMAHRADLGPAAKTRLGWREVVLSTVLDLVDDRHVVDLTKSYPNVGLYSFCRGIFHKPPIEGSATSAKVLRRIAKGQFIYSRLFAFEGAYAFVSPEFDGAYVSQEYPTFNCDPAAVSAEFLAAYFKPEYVWRSVAEGSKGLGSRRQRVQPFHILQHRLWLPPIDWQHQLAQILLQVEHLKAAHTAQVSELDALIPSALDRALRGEL